MRNALPIHIVFAADSRFLQYTAVAAWSALNNAGQDIHFHLLCDRSQITGSRAFCDMVAAFGGQVSFHQVDISRLSGLPVTGHVSLATYYRLLIAEILPEEVSRVIYLDGDLIVRRCLSDLYHVPLGATGVAAVPESSPESERLGIPGAPYFNAGVLVLDLELWRRESVTDTLLVIANTQQEKLRYWDQDVLALYLKGNFTPLDDHWNVTHRYFFGESRLPLPAHSPAIIHFSGDSLKPWNKHIKHPYLEEFWAIADRVRPFGFELTRPGKLRHKRLAIINFLCSLKRAA